MVRINMDGKGRALDNIYIERFWKTLKYEDIYLYRKASCPWWPATPTPGRFSPISEPDRPSTGTDRRLGRGGRTDRPRDLPQRQAEEVGFQLLMNHLEHMISVAGIYHVGLGSDFDGYEDADGVAMASVLDLNRITTYLRKTGRSKDEIAKVMGGNWLRVMEAVCG